MTGRENDRCFHRYGHGVKDVRNTPPEEGKSKLRSWLRETPTWVEIVGILLAIAAIAIPLTVAGGSSPSSQRGPAELAVDVFLGQGLRSRSAPELAP
jgi:hypothetical protein